MIVDTFIASWPRLGLAIFITAMISTKGDVQESVNILKV